MLEVRFLDHGYRHERAHNDILVQMGTMGERLDGFGTFGRLVRNNAGKEPIPAHLANQKRRRQLPSTFMGEFRWIRPYNGGGVYRVLCFVGASLDAAFIQ